jgi:peroxiredoxin
MSALDGLQGEIDSFRDAGVQIIAVSPDSEAENREVAEKWGLEFPILSDSDLVLTKAMGLLHEKGGMAPDFKDIPRPAIFIVRDGIVRWRSLTDNYRVRIRPGPLLEAWNQVSEG